MWMEVKNFTKRNRDKKFHIFPYLSLLEYVLNCPGVDVFIMDSHLE